MQTTVNDIIAVTEAFGKLDGMNPEGMIYKRLVRILDACDDEAIVAVKNANIKFVSSLALNRCIKRGLIRN